MSKIYALDASALLCLLFAERGAERVAAVLPECVISAINLAEVVAKLSEHGGRTVAIHDVLNSLDLDAVAFDRDQAVLAGLLRARTRAFGLSLGDRACLAVATMRGAIALTCDATWAKLDVGCAVELAR